MALLNNSHNNQLELGYKANQQLFRFLFYDNLPEPADTLKFKW